MNRITGVKAAMLLLGGMTLTAAARDGASEAKRKLDSTRVSVDFKSAPLADVIAFLREQTDLNFHLAKDDAGAEVTLKLKDVSARTVLRFAMKPHDLTAVWRDGVIVIEPRGKTSEKRVTRIYDVSALEFGYRNFSNIDFLDSFCGTCISAAGVRFMDDGIVEFGRSAVGFLVDMIFTQTGGASWDGDPRTSIDLANGRLIVTQTPAVHREIAMLLRKLEQYH